MGRSTDQFISPVEAAKVLERTPEEVLSLCNEGLIRKKSTGQRVLVHLKDVEEVRETNLHARARPKDIVSRLLLLERKVKSLAHALDLFGAVSGMTSTSLDELSDQELVALSESVREALSLGSWDLDDMLKFSEVFLRISDSDVIRLNEALGTNDSWKDFYVLALNMSTFARKMESPPSRDLDTVRALLQQGLRNLRSIGVLFIENSAYLETSKTILQKTMSHDLAEFDTLIRKLKHRR